MAALYVVEKSARYEPVEERLALRQEKAQPIFDHLEAWLQLQLPKISGKSAVAVCSGERVPHAQPHALERGNQLSQRHSGRTDTNSPVRPRVTADIQALGASFIRAAAPWQRLGRLKPDGMAIGGLPARNSPRGLAQALLPAYITAYRNASV